MSFNSHCVFMCFSDLPHHKASHACQAPELLSAIELLKSPKGHSAQKRGGRPPYLTCGIRCHRLAGHAAIAPLFPALQAQVYQTSPIQRQTLVGFRNVVPPTADDDRQVANLAL